MFIKSGPILYSIDGKDEEMFRNGKETSISFESFWGLNKSDLKEHGILATIKNAHVRKEDAHVVLLPEEELLLGAIVNGETESESSYIWVKKGQTILSMENFDFIFNDKAEELIRSLSDYKEGFLSGKERLKERIYEEDVEQYYINIQKADRKYILRIGKKHMPGVKEKKYEIFAENIASFMKKAMECIKDYLTTLTKDVTIKEKEHKRNEEEIREL